MAALLEEGAGELDATGFAEAREALAARFDFDARARRGRRLGADADREPRREPGAAQAALTEPRFDPEAVARVQGQLLSILRSDATDPDAIAGVRFYADAFPGHPYARPSDGTLESVAGARRRRRCARRTRRRWCATG